MSGEENIAEQKFWGTPELVEMILPFLDLTSILSLEQKDPAGCHCLEQTYQTKLSPGWGAGGSSEETCAGLETDAGARNSDA